MKKLIFIFGLGLLPLWAVFATTAFRGYTLATHWEVMLAVPWCLVSLVIASFTSFVHHISPGTGVRKSVLAASVFTVLTALEVFAFLVQK